MVKTFLHYPPICIGMEERKGDTGFGTFARVYCRSCERHGGECKAEGGRCYGNLVDGEVRSYSEHVAEVEASYKLDCPSNYRERFEDAGGR